MALFEQQMATYIILDSKLQYQIYEIQLILKINSTVSVILTLYDKTWQLGWYKKKGVFLH